MTSSNKGVWTVSWGDYESWGIHAIYDNQADAERKCAQIHEREDAAVAFYEFDESPPEYAWYGAEYKTDDPPYLLWLKTYEEVPNSDSLMTWKPNPNDEYWYEAIGTAWNIEVAFQAESFAQAEIKADDILEQVEAGTYEFDYEGVPSRWNGTDVVPVQATLVGTV